MGKSKNKKNLTTLAKNIKALRTYYGETQVDLAKILNCEQQEISQYESGKRLPTADKLKDLAHHFERTVFEIENYDFENMDDEESSELFFYNNIDTLLPIICTGHALNNELFNKAYQLHKTIYKSFKSATNIDLVSSELDTTMDSLEELESYYHDALKDKNCESEAAVNLVACCYLGILYLESLQIICTENGRHYASISKAKKTHPKFEKEINDIDLFSIDENAQLESLISALVKETHEYQIISKAKYPDLIDYYLALQFRFGFAENDLDHFTNRMIGTEIMKSFKNVGNKYANRFLNM